jgi:ribosomal protein S21
MSALRRTVAGLTARLLAAGAPAWAPAAPAAAAAAAAPAAALPSLLAARRSLISVEVQNGRVDRALRTLKKRVIEEGFVREWQAGATHTKPSAQRKLDAAETEKRLQRRAFKRKMRWIMTRQQRGF